MNRFLDPEQRFMGPDEAPFETDDPGAVVIPVPYERTSSYGTGSGDGPEAIIAASHQVEFHDADLGFEPWAAAGGIATMEPLPTDDCRNGEEMAARLEAAAAEQIDAGRTVVTLAGEHTGVVGAVRAHVRRFDDLTVLQLDAHSDLRPEYRGERWNHACAMARVFDFHRAIVQVGIRSEAAEEASFTRRHRIPVFHGERIARDDRRGADWVAPIVGACTRRVYITLDLDVLDPSIMPATGTPEPGGLDWRQLNRLLARLCREREVVGFDVCEIAPLPGIRFPEFTAAKLVYRLTGLVCRSVCRERAGRAGGGSAEPTVRVGTTAVGRGLFAAREFEAGNTILELRGDPLDFKATLVKGDRECDALQIGPDAYLDLEPPGVLINHSCDPNAAVAEGPRLIALRPVKTGEEIRYDYSTTMDDDHWTLPCRCESDRCRGVVRDFKWLPKEWKLELIRRGAVLAFIVESELKSGRLTAGEVESARAGRPRTGVGTPSV